MTWFNSTNSNVTNGSNIIKINDNQSVANIRPSDALVLSSFAPVEISKAYVTTHGTFIELIKPWPNATQSQVPCVVLPTSGDFNTAVSALNNASKMVNDNYKTMIDWQTKAGEVTFKDLEGNLQTITTLRQMQLDINAKNPYPHAMTEAQFEALRSQRKQHYPGSGFIEMGKHYSGTNQVPINEGMTAWTTRINTLLIGSADSSISHKGTSKQSFPLVVIDGVSFELAYINDPVYSKIEFYDAPNGTQTYDTQSGALMQHSSVDVAFATESPTNRVVLSRQDLVLLVKRTHSISDTDGVYPGANRQWGKASYLGASTTNGQHTWSSLSPATKDRYLAEPKNNIRKMADGTLCQDSVEVVVVNGFGNHWRSESHGTEPWQAPILGYGTQPINAESLTLDSAARQVFSRSDSDKGVFKNAAHTSFVLPIALVQRLNQGAYHPTYNPLGCGAFGTMAHHDNAAKFYEGAALKPASTLECFTKASTYEQNGNITAPSGYQGRLDGYQFYDAVYAGQVHDLRLNVTNKVSLEAAFQSAILGSLRGKARIPFTRTTLVHSVNLVTDTQNKVLIRDHTAANSLYRIYGVRQPPFEHAVYVTTTDNRTLKVGEVNKDAVGDYFYVYADSTTGLSSGDIICYHDFETLSAEFDVVPIVEVLGTPEKIAALFPNGFAGRVNHTHLPSSSTPATEKITSSYVRLLTSNTGSAWSSKNYIFNHISNTFSDTVNAGDIALYCYDAPATFTTLSDNNPTFQGPSNVFASSHHAIDRGNRLMQSLTQRIGTDSTEHTQAFVLLTSHALDAQGKLTDGPTHLPLPTLSASNGYAFKAIASLVENSGLVYLQFNAATLKHDNNNWGDSGTLRIVDGEITDAEQLITRCSLTYYPLGFA
ncbi:hypothetical protein JL49_16960 [Pseudoalteromonas luteoviolacea]|nr:hypothetical protein JL49_16960 [Pseudoalteromonas luteoviolacea]